MSSSCVPPKACVVHNPDPPTPDDHSDTTSECGSLCSCTSSSMASIVTINNNNTVLESQNENHENEATALVPSLPVAQIVSQTEEEEDTRYSLTKVFKRMVCCKKLGSLPLTASIRHFLLTTGEFVPWLAGFIIIYYSYRWWGMASAFSAFLFMIGAHAVLRFIKTRGVLSCIPHASRHRAQISTPEAEDNDETDVQQVPQQVPVDHSAEKPPSYDVAVVKPPPYDLQLHLTPKKLHNAPTNKSRRCTRTELLAATPARISSEESRHESDMLPSYHDAMRSSFHNNRQGNRESS